MVLFLSSFKIIFDEHNEQWTSNVYMLNACTFQTPNRVCSSWHLNVIFDVIYPVPISPHRSITEYHRMPTSAQTVRVDANEILSGFQCYQTSFMKNEEFTMASFLFVCCSCLIILCTSKNMMAGIHSSCDIGLYINPSYLKISVHFHHSIRLIWHKSNLKDNKDHGPKGDGSKSEKVSIHAAKWLWSQISNVHSTQLHSTHPLLFWPIQ